MLDRFVASLLAMTARSFQALVEAINYKLIKAGVR
jgi:hypothetical protein